MNEKSIYSFTVDKGYVPRERLCIYMPVELSKKYTECAKIETKLRGEKISRNKFILEILDEFMKTNGEKMLLEV